MDRCVEQQLALSLIYILHTLAATALQPLLNLELECLRGVILAIHLLLRFLQLFYEVMEVLSSILLLAGLELLVTFAK